MAQGDIKELVIRGKASYAKVLGDPIPNYNKDGKEWKIDLILTDKGSIEEVKAAGIGDRIKRKESYWAANEPHLSMKQTELRKDGTPNRPINIVDAKGNPWPQDKLIGNGSIIDLKFVVIDNGPSKFKGVYPRSIRVLDLVPYEKEEFAPLSEDDEFYASENTETVVEQDLDDDLPM